MFILGEGGFSSKYEYVIWMGNKKRISRGIGGTPILEVETIRIGGE